jgi:hypothetical protein
MLIKPFKELSSVFDLRSSFFSHHFDVLSLFFFRSYLIKIYPQNKQYIGTSLTEEKRIGERKASKKPNDRVACVYPSSVNDSWASHTQLN